MEICDKKKHYLLSMDIQTITGPIVHRISNILKKSTKPTVIDMDSVEECVIGFFRLFKKYPDVTLINLDSKLLATLCMTGFDKYVKIYEEKVSCQENKRELKNRKFNLVNIR